MGCSESHDETKIYQSGIQNLPEIAKILQALKPKKLDLSDRYFKIHSEVDEKLITIKELEKSKDAVLRRIITIMEDNEKLQQRLNELRAEPVRESVDSAAALELDELNLEFQNIKKEKQYLESTSEEIIINNAFTISKDKISKKLYGAFFKWKNTQSKGKMVRKFGKQKSIVDVKRIRNSEDQTLLDINLILKKVEERGTKNGKALDLGYTFKFLENLMDDKFEADRKMIEEGKIPRELTVFMIEKVFERYDNENLAFKFISELVLALHSLYKMNQTYGILFCRIFNMYHSQPIPYRLSIYLTQVRMYFQQLKHLKPVDESMGSPVKGFLEVSYGGESLLSDVIDLAHLLFRADFELGIRVLRECKPSGLGMGEFCLYIITQKMHNKHMHLQT